MHPDRTHGSRAGRGSTSEGESAFHVCRIRTFDVEEQLDIEAGYAMAPDQHQLLVGGDTCDQHGSGIQAIIDADLAVLDGNGRQPLASITSNSWELPGGEGGQHDQYDSILHSVLLRAAGEGVGMYYSSGDGPGVLYPSSDPYALAVGGTSLGIGSDGKRLFETGCRTTSK